MEKNLNNYPKSIRTLRKWFPRIEWISSSLAGAIAKKLFFTPLRYEIPQREKEIADRARLFKFQFRNLLLQGYEWGEGPVVILLHGWSGRATQFAEFVGPLVAVGFKVVSFDAPGHNASPGKYADLVLFSESLKTLAARYEDIQTVVGHSLGGAATLHALQNGLKLESAVVIGTPSIPADIIRNFTFIINSSDKMGEYITKHIRKTYGKSFESYGAQETGKDANIPVMVIHDENDNEVSVRDAKELTKVLKQGQLLITQGLGHVKILRDTDVIDRAIFFIKDATITTEMKKAI